MAANNWIEEKVIYEKLTGSVPVRAGVLEKAAAQPSALPEDEKVNMYLAEIGQRIAAMESTRQNFAFRPLYSCRKYIGKMIVFFKRAVRKCLKWYVEPICFQQTDFNSAVTPAIGRLTELQQISFARIQDCKAAQEDAGIKMKGIELQITELFKTAVNIETASMQAADQAESASLQAVDRIGASLDQAVLQFAERAAALDEKIKQQEELLAHSEQVSQEHEQELQQRRQDFLEQDRRFGEQSEVQDARFCALEKRFDDMEKQYGLVAQQLDQANNLLQQLQEEGAFAEINANAKYIQGSAAQSGEDRILSYVFRTLGIPEEACSYLDLGANHAKFLSNTYSFYRVGARGVLVEANPNLIGELKLYRSGDVILNRCVSDSSGQIIDFYIISGDGLSTPNKEEAEAVVAYNPTLQIDQVVSVPTITVNEILETYFERAPVFMNIDIEGEEMKILHSIDFAKYRPLALSIETIPYRSHLVIGLKRQEIVDFMREKDYVEYAFTGINSIFLDKYQIQELIK